MNHGEMAPGRSICPCRAYRRILNDKKYVLMRQKYAIFAKPDIFANHDAEIYYRTRLVFNILYFLARPRPRNKRFYATRIDFSDSGKTSRVDLGLEQPEMARNRKIERDGGEVFFVFLVCNHLCSRPCCEPKGRLFPADHGAEGFGIEVIADGAYPTGARGCKENIG